MKKLFTRSLAVFAVAAAAMACPVDSDAYFQDAGIFFEVLDDDNCTVISNMEQGYYRGDVVVPSQATDPDTQKTYTVAAIGLHAFNECSGMTSISLPETIRIIEMRSFNYCTGLTSITLPASLRSLGHVVFTFSTNLKEINVAEGSKYFKSVDGVLYDAKMETLVVCPPGLQSLVVPEGVREIGYAACNNCSELRSVVLPESLEVIGVGGFQSCEMLPEIEIPDGVVSIDSWGFDSCFMLEEVKLGKSVETLGSAAFQQCGSLTRFVAGDALRTVGESCFMGCPNLEYAYLGKSLESIGFDAFSTCDMLKTLVIPTKTVPEVEEDSFSSDQYRDTELYLLEESIPLFAEHDIWLYFEKMMPYEDTGVCRPVAEAENLRVEAADGRLHAEAAAPIELYSADGQLVSRANGTLEASPAPGVYIVRSGTESRKVRL